MARGFGWIIGICLTATVVVAAGASPDALKADYQKADAELNRVYKAVCKEIGEEKAKALRDLERGWLGFRDGMAEARPHFEGVDAKDPKQTTMYWEAMAELTRERTEFLRVYSGKGIAKGPAGDYFDCFGGEVELKEVAGGIAFKIEVARGPTAHIGEIEGVAVLKGDRAEFVEVLKAEDKADPNRKPCKLAFTFSEGHIVKIEGENTSYYHGARAFFDGTYYKRNAPTSRPVDDRK